MKDRAAVKQWIRNLVVDIGMKPIGDPHIEYTAGDIEDKAGYTVIQIVVTSSIVAHFVDNLSQIYLDVFSCKRFDHDVVQSSVSNAFGATTFSKYYLTRQAN